MQVSAVIFTVALKKTDTEWPESQCLYNLISVVTVHLEPCHAPMC